jgi:very-short-patch-repair endonuclease
MGLRIARFRNEEILQNSETVAMRIRELITNEQG